MRYIKTQILFSMPMMCRHIRRHKGLEKTILEEKRQRQVRCEKDSTDVLATAAGRIVGERH